MTDIATIAALGTAPIPGANPGGESARYDAEFQRLEAEVGKLENLSGGEVDWAAVANDATALLANRSKDLLVAAYLCRAAYQQHGLPGVVVGLRLLRDLLTTFWDTAFPAAARVKARRGALEWAGERLATTVQAADLAHADSVQAVLVLIGELDGIARDKFDGEDAGFSALRHRLNELNEGVPAPAADHAAPATATVGSAATAAPAFTAAASAVPVVSRAAAIARLKEVAAYYRVAEPHSPVLFLVERAIGWSGKPFTDILGELLKNRDDAREHILDLLGIVPPPAPADG